MNQKLDIRGRPPDSAFRRKVFPACAIAVFFLLACFVPAFADDNDASIYEVTDVAVDITADSAAHARDQALAEAQRSALEQLLGRLGADSSLAAKLDDDGVAALVQSFEVQSERTSSVRYIGTFTVQFRPDAMRDWLSKNGAAYIQTRSKPVIVLPITNISGHPILWEQQTKWWMAWENAHADGLVPIILPAGGIDDISVLSTEEAVGGDGSAIKALIEKYQAGGAVVAVLDGDLDNPGSPFKITVTRYDDTGAAAAPVSLDLPPASDKSAIDNALVQGVRQVRATLESSWRQTVAQADQTPPTRLPVIVPIDTLDEWTQIKRKLDSVHAIDKTDVIMLARGTTNIEIEFRGGMEQLQDDLARQNLTLTQDGLNGTWILQMAVPEQPL